MIMIIYIFLSYVTRLHASNQTGSRDSLACANRQPNTTLLHALGLATESQAPLMQARMSSFTNQTDPNSNNWTMNSC